MKRPTELIEGMKANIDQYPHGDYALIEVYPLVRYIEELEDALSFKEKLMHEEMEFLRYN